MSASRHSHNLEEPLVVQIDISDVHLLTKSGKTSSSNSKLCDLKVTEISSAACALFNSCCGGFIKLNFIDKCSELICEEPKLIDDIGRRIEQSVLKIASSIELSKLFKLEKVERHWLLLSVKSSPRFCTVQFFMYTPSDYQINAIDLRIRSAEIASLLEPQLSADYCAPKFPKHFTRFCYDERLSRGRRESQTVQFKLLKNEPESNGRFTRTLADRIVNKSNKVTNTVSAFANHEGGHMYFGVDDNTSTVKGQEVSESEKVKIRKKISLLLSKMVWPVSQPERFWKISFHPVFDCQIQKFSTFRYIIVLSVAKCPGGVHVEEPESYHLEKGKVSRIPFSLWKKRFIEDAKKCEAHRSWNENSASQAIVALYGTKDIPVIKWSSAEYEKDYMSITQHMEELRNNGCWRQINTIEKKILGSDEYNADQKLAVTFQCTAAAYRQKRFTAANKYLESYHSLVKDAKNLTIFEVQELYSLSAIKRSEKDYEASYGYTCQALQKMQLIQPGWITAWYLCNAASLLTIFAGEESDPQKKDDLIEQAKRFYEQALVHNQAIIAYPKAAANLHHRVHINLAMLCMDSSPSKAVINLNQDIPLCKIQMARDSLHAAENFEGPPMTGFNEFHFLLAKSDLALRCYERDPVEGRGYLSEAITNAKRAYEVANDKAFAEVQHYAETRIVLFESMLPNEPDDSELLDDLLQNLMSEN
ncbi:uncharacterized protein LOC124437322 [Xenia sp. Carnegie-2017]|uniref:uncharacterized protein LOC124437322 n=1 Tax=Xenia sp. Carnegie-2017 TaxID=2897299 RepID=UPI001F04E4D8|nr:uncharacterized protein LOC124437322 [Xenia sp. Carnegie-2017]